MKIETTNLEENRSVLNTDHYSVEVRESSCNSGIIIDVWERDGSLIDSFQFLNDDLVYTMAEKSG